MDNATNKEIFKDIKGYVGYQISNEGRVWSIKSQRYLKQNTNGGYKRVCLMAPNGKKKFEYVHRLVALHFIDNPEGKTQVDHIDRNRENNTVENLRWVSVVENNNNRKDNKYSKEWYEKHHLI